MGLSRLRIVSGCEHLHPDSFRLAVSAKDLLEQAETFSSLPGALADINLSIATTRRHGKYRQELLTPPQAAAALIESSQKSALVFGREDHGLSTEELSFCTLQATIASNDEYGSLNLAQAILIFCYELFGATSPELVKPKQIPATSGEIEPVFAQMKKTLQRIGYLNPQNPEHVMRSLRRILFRANMDSREVAIIRGIFSQIDWATGDFKDRKGTT